MNQWVLASVVHGIILVSDGGEKAHLKHGYLGITKSTMMVRFIFSMCGHS